MDGLKARLSFDAVAYDYDDEYLTIDTDTHTININNVSRLFGVQYDGNSKLIKFRVRNKLSDIQKMQDSIVYINWTDSRGVALPILGELRVSQSRLTKQLIMILVNLHGKYRLML